MQVLRGVVARLFLVIAFAVTIFAFTNNLQAVENTWINHPGIKFTKIDEFTDSSKLPSVMQGKNRDCGKTLLTTKPAVVRIGLADTPALTSEDCVISTGYGVVGGSLFLKSGTDVAGNVTLRSREVLIAGPNQHTAIIGNSSGAPLVGIYVGILENPLIDIETKVQTDKTVKHTLKPTAVVKDIKNSVGTRLLAVPETVAFSSGGDWMVFDSPNYGLVRADTSTGQTISFGEPNNYNNGSLGVNLAISSDGRYVVFARNGVLNIYDLNSCVAKPVPNSHIMKCDSKSLYDQKERDASFGGTFIVRFTSSDSFTYYTDKLVSGVLTIRKYRVTMGDVPEFGYQYLGLGDSFASGEGAFNYKTITQNKCHISLRSYPYLIGEDLNKEDYESIACSGALTLDILQDTQATNDYKGQIGDNVRQEDRQSTFNNIFQQFTPGLLTQNTFLEKLRPETVTVSVGGNDLGFADKIKACVMPGTCFDTVEDRKEVAEEIYELVETLTPVYQELKKNNRRVYVVGYPKIAQPGGNCAVNIGLNATELAFADKLTVLINDAIDFAAGQAGVSYIDVENIFAGRKLCETNSENTLIHGITEDHTRQGIKLATESFHPKQDAHVLYKNAILQQTNNLTKPMPQRNNPAYFPRLQPTDEFFRELESSGRAVYKPIYEDIVDIVFSGDDLEVDLDSNFTGLGPLAQVKAELHSTPISLGTFTTDSGGNLSAEVVIPENIEPGYHSIHFYGVSQTGQNIDIYDYFFVRVSETDFDGDGVLDEDEGCVYTTPIGADTDQDGIDDACDGVVDPLPESETPPEEEVIDVPVINPIEPPKDIDGNGETVAGNEEMVTPEPEPTTQNPNPQPAANRAVFRNVETGNLNLTQTEPEVLSETVAVNSDAGQITTPPSSVNDQTEPQVVKDTKVYIWYLIAGIIAFIGLVMFILVAMKKQKHSNS